MELFLAFFRPWPRCSFDVFLWEHDPTALYSTSEQKNVCLPPSNWLDAFQITMLYVRSLFSLFFFCLVWSLESEQCRVATRIIFLLSGQKTLTKKKPKAFCFWFWVPAQHLKVPSHERCACIDAHEQPMTPFGEEGRKGSQSGIESYFSQQGQRTNKMSTKYGSLPGASQVSHVEARHPIKSSSISSRRCERREKREGGEIVWRPIVSGRTHGKGWRGGGV